MAIKEACTIETKTINSTIEAKLDSCASIFNKSKVRFTKVICNISLFEIIEQTLNTSQMGQLPVVAGPMLPLVCWFINVSLQL
jgi:hypothetical protein